MIRAELLSSWGQQYGVLPPDVLEADALEMFHIHALLNAKVDEES